MPLPMIQEKPGLAALVGAGLGQGLQQGVTTGAEYGLKLGLEKSKQREQQNVLTKFSDELLKQNPDDPRFKTLSSIYKLDLPSDLKHTLVKELVGEDPYDLSRKFYLNRKDIAESYDRQIKNYNELIKSGAFSDVNQMNDFQSQIQKLMKEREQHLAVYDAGFKSQLGFTPPQSVNPEPAAAPSPAQETTKPLETPPQKEEVKAKEPEPANKHFWGKESSEKPRLFKSKTGKPKFDLRNPEHLKRRNQILSKSGGDREKARQVMLKEFSE